ncbi:phospholipase D, Pi-sPLD-like-1 [Phytophthora infestans T30-4]|uniref:Phospholipase D, Pi-sPLD-like-1 n=1 Tax=Phytophthora infestans (strain T30-4) TaxID=403677 RepID=D0NX76_PHYIT|nr:phospholipase D, Pi-sPLD-like-1 [Phytophthora infestans T30-4]EEY67671.1 phospholipase D, Pi-sPLD-like-1 [Phytophthora infestans T30-4]|eukprot:XP_002896334.1 phospholipase D, Pi-sPLD-like-1 [Phytophthora infestans T30-4]
MPRRLSRGDGAALFGLLWAASCVFLVALRFTPREIANSATPASKSRVFDPKWTSDSVSNELLTGKATLSLVESLPVGDFDLSSSVPQTFEALTRHVVAAKRSIDLSAMYWNLLGEEDRKVYTDAEMTKFGADRGKNLLLALKEAAIRGVKIRVLTAKQNVETGEIDEAAEMSCGSLPSEVQMLVNAAKKKVEVRCWSGPEWYGSGILHQKIWIFDDSHVYVGSANMDWKSLAQVMEVGVVMEDLSPTSNVIQDMKRLYETWWMFASPELLPAKTDRYFSERFQHELQVPKWSLYLPTEKRNVDPFVKAGLSALGNISHQLQTTFNTPLSGNDTERGAETADMFVAAAPLEATAAHSRAFDEDALVYTIRSAKSFIGLSVMDFVPFSMYTPGPLHWPALTDALLAGVYSKPGLQVCLLISQWQHTSTQMLKALATLKKQADLCQHTHARCSGRLEIKIFRVPGWQNTTSSARTKAVWPSYTRVNHAKYIVTDTRVNVGTSNMEWGYFYTTAGASVNTNHEPTRKALENVFKRNWNSSYAKSLEEIVSAES